MSILNTSQDNSSSPYTIVDTLPFSFCQLLNFPSSGIDCFVNDSSKCVKCSAPGTYLTGTAGFTVVVLILSLTILVSILGIFFNVLIVKVLGRYGFKSSFDRLLTWLAAVDLVSCLVTISAAISNTSFLGTYKNFKNHKLVLQVSKI